MHVENISTACSSQVQFSLTQLCIVYTVKSLVRYMITPKINILASFRDCNVIWQTDLTAILCISLVKSSIQLRGFSSLLEDYEGSWSTTRYTACNLLNSFFGVSAFCLFKQICK